MTLSDLADKFAFLKAVILPYLFSVLTVFIILYLMSEILFQSLSQLQTRINLIKDLLNNAGQGF